MPTQVPFDVVIYGASGFTGRLVAEYMSQQYDRSVNWAMAGRSATKLAAVRDEIGAAKDTPLVVADASDPASCAPWSPMPGVSSPPWGPINSTAQTLSPHAPNWGQTMSTCQVNPPGCMK